MTTPAEHPEGYRLAPSGGPRVRSDIIDVYIFRPAAAHPDAPTSPDAPMPSTETSGGVEFLQLLRAGDPLAGTWHPVMAHIEAGETAAACARRELMEEVGLDVSGPAALGFWALEQVHPYFVAAIDAIVLSPRFAVEVPRGWTPRLNAEHAGARWVHEREAGARFMWPGQVAACHEIVRWIVPDRLTRESLRVR